MSSGSVIPELDIFNLPVFAVADLFPMIANDELAELAEDIKEHGLQEPVVIQEINGEWMLIDGRNRLAACRLLRELVEVEPGRKEQIYPTITCRVLEGDPTAYVLSANVHRRHLTKGQQAMATALAYPDTEKGGRGKKSLANNDFSGASSGYIRQARFVLRNCRDKAIEVLRNSKYPLTVAYEEAQAIVEEQRIAEEERQKQLAALAILREEYSDLAALVDDQRLGLPEAIAAGDQRREQARLKREQEARELAEKKRQEDERLARQANLEAQAAQIATEAPDLAEKVLSGKMDFETAKRHIIERESTAKAQRDAALDAFYRFTENCPMYANDAGVQRLESYLSNYSEEYRDRWRRSVKESLVNFRTLLKNSDAILNMINRMI